MRPTPYWSWFLVSRLDEPRDSVRATIRALTDGVDTAALGLNGPDTWQPPGDPRHASPGGRVIPG